MLVYPAQSAVLTCARIASVFIYRLCIFMGVHQLDKQCLIFKYTNELAMDSFAYEH